ncbi:hypothetical protein [Kitasatospora fiedleri]|uniref:hypothetical protein n=1 Tax=Kitasatospora fiedleri TaxID=2991545 RepID=UPI002499CFBA|nr:hypothetical protein [Kitasatospora fiedleri]
MGVEAVGVAAGPDVTELRGRAVEPGPPPGAGMVVCENLVRVRRSEGVEVQALPGLHPVVEDGELIAPANANSPALLPADEPTEVLRPERGEPGVAYAVLDRVGRLPLPADSAEALRLSRRVRLAWEEDHIAVWRAEEEVHG